jgi:c-di-GMP-binding flagellar brake protein YcgR
MSEVRRQTVRIDVNAEVTVRLLEQARELRLLLVDISESGARLRTPLKLPQNGRIAFAWVGPSRQPIAITGQVVAVHASQSKTFDYGVTFTMPPAERDRLVRDLAEVQRRRAFRTGGETRSAGGRDRRRHYRAALRFPVHVRAKKEGRSLSVRADAHDISTSGMLVALPGDHDDGTELQLTFTLPISAVDQGAPIRPFEPIDAKAHIVHKRGAAEAAASLYGITFADFSPFLQEEIARFVHAYQVTQLRKGAAQDN